MKLRNIIPCLTALTVLSVGSVAYSQSYDISWYKIAGGGGTSSGGNYSLSGTIGQHDAGTMSGGNYSLTGGFWGIISVVQTPGSPTLTIVGTTTNTVVLQWISPSTGFTLQQTASLSPTNWTSVNTTTYPITVNNGSNTITLPISGNEFFRLVHP